MRSISEPTQTKAGAGPAARASGGKRSRSTPQLTTATLRPAAEMLRSSSRRSQSETATTAAAPRTTSRLGAPDEWILRQVRDVLPVRGHDEWRARGPRGEQGAEPGGEEEVRVDDVGPEAAGSANRASGEANVSQLRAATLVEHDALELVPALGERPLEALDEDAEVGRRGRRVHLRDEQDPHRRII